MLHRVRDTQDYSAAVALFRHCAPIELMPVSGYHLTEMGKELLGTFLPLHNFSKRWSGGRTRAT
jgi:hypothetical protein